MQDTPYVPAVIYAAKSTEDERGSIPTQLADARTAAEAAGRLVAGEYSDEAASAFHGNRGAGLAAAKDHAIRLAAEHGTAELWMQHSDRVARGDGIEANHLAEVYFSLRRASVRLRSVQDDSNLEDAIRVVLIGERNHEDSKRKSAAVAAGMRRRKAKGLHNVGGPGKYGYDVVRDEFGRPAPVPLKINVREARVVRRIFDDLAKGISQKQLARDLNDDGLAPSAAASGGRARSPRSAATRSTPATSASTASLSAPSTNRSSTSTCGSASRRSSPTAASTATARADAARASRCCSSTGTCAAGAAAARWASGARSAGSPTAACTAGPNTSAPPARSPRSPLAICRPSTPTRSTG